MIKYFDEENKKTIKTLNNINFDSEIESIECLGEIDTIDIEVSDDHLFYANNILTKNSIGIPFVCDSIFAIIRDDDLDEQGEVWIKVLKNRYAPIVNKKFNLGANIDNQYFYDVGQEEQSDFNINDLSKEDTKTNADFSKFNFK